MTPEEFKSTLTEDEINNINTVIGKINNITVEDRDIYLSFIRKSSEVLGEDQILEPVRYILASMGGLRREDLQALIGEDFNPEIFDRWNNLFENPILPIRNLAEFLSVYDLSPKMRELMRNEIGESNLRSCASDIGYYLLEHKQPGDIIRDTQTLHLLLDGKEAAAAAEYVSSVGDALFDMTARVLAKGMNDAPDDVKQTITDLTRVEGEKIDAWKIMILTNVAKLRNAQAARFHNNATEAQKLFLEAMNSVVPPLLQADPRNVTSTYIKLYWLCLKICQEMAQPKAMSLFFEQIIRIEQAQTQDTKRNDEERAQIAENIVCQHIDMSKVYYTMPKELQEQFKNYAETTVSLLKAFLQKGEEEKEQSEEFSINDMGRLAGYYQSLGELCLRLERSEESYDALTEAQILQMRQLAAMQKQDGQEAMSQQQLFCRLALSTTNHILAAHYRLKGKTQHDLGIVLRSNMNLAEDCFKFYPRNPRVIHFIINAALELGDYQHNSRGLLAECGTYKKVIEQFSVLNNMQIDHRLAIDIAMIHTKCGLVQADKTIHCYKDAIKNLEVAHRLWKTICANTKNPNFVNNAKVVEQMLSQLKGN